MTRTELMEMIEGKIKSELPSFEWDYPREMEKLNAEINVAGFVRDQSSFGMGQYIMMKEPVEPKEAAKELLEDSTGFDSPSDLDIEIKDCPALAGEPIVITDGRLQEVLKGVRKATLPQTTAMFEEFIQVRSNDIHIWKMIADKYYPNISMTNTLRNIVLKFQKAGMLSWNGSCRSEIRWL